MGGTQRAGTKAGVNDQPDVELERRKWIDPTSEERFREVRLSDGSTSEGLLEDIAHLSDQLFDHLSVLEQFAEVTSRGATADIRLKVDVSSIRARLARARLELSEAHHEVSALRTAFVNQQLEGLRQRYGCAGLKLHIGAGGTILEGWVNIDAGGGDLAANVNWGLPFQDDSVAFVYAAHILEHLRYRDQGPRLLREIHRVLSHGGVARFVVPDIRRLLEAYVHHDAQYFSARCDFYPLSEGFMVDGVAALDYILLFCGANSQTMNYNHKFGYDETTLPKLLLDAGFSIASPSGYQASSHQELLVDDRGYNAVATSQPDEHFSLFVEAVK